MDDRVLLAFAGFIVLVTGFGLLVADKLRGLVQNVGVGGGLFTVYIVSQLCVIALCFWLAIIVVFGGSPKVVSEEPVERGLWLKKFFRREEKLEFARGGLSSLMNPPDLPKAEDRFKREEWNFIDGLPDYQDPVQNVVEPYPDNQWTPEPEQDYYFPKDEYGNPVEEYPTDVVEDDEKQQPPEEDYQFKGYEFRKDGV